MVRFVHAPHLFQHAADIVGRSNEKYFVAGLHHGAAFGDDGAILTEDRRNTCFDLRHVGAQKTERLAHQRSAFERAHRHQRYFAFGEFQHLQGFGEFNELGNVLGEDLLRADGEIDAEIVRAEYRLAVEIVGGADARDARRGVVKTRRQFARDQIYLVALRHGQQHIGVGDARLFQYRRMRRVANQRAQIQPVLQLAQLLAIRIDHGDVIRFADQVFRHRRADLSRTQNQNLQNFTFPERRDASGNLFISTADVRHGP